LTVDADMQNVPQFVLKRLKETQPAIDSHPDSNLLTAFAEQSLAGDEHTRVMEHFVLCGDCRDVVAIALPEIALPATEIIAMPVPASPARTGWMRWPALRWGALAAGILAVASISIGVLQLSRRSQQNLVASNRVQKAASSPATFSEAPVPQASAPQAPVPQDGTRQAFAHRSETITADKIGGEAKMIRPRVINGVETHPGSGRGAGIGAGVGGGFSLSKESAVQAPEAPPAAAGQPQNSAPETRQQEIVGSMSEAVEVQSAAGPVTTESSQNQVAQNEANKPLNGRDVTNLNSLDVVKAKEPVAGQSASNAAPMPQLASPSPLQTAPQLMLRASPRWSINSSGMLQRSFDGGNTWAAIDPALNATSIGGPMAKESAGNADAARFSPAEPNPARQKKAEASPNATAIFRAVAAAGLEVWAGGSGGVLYHTSDGGNRWTRVVPSNGDMLLTGDITLIQFSDTQHGKISTSAGEVWITSDGGQSWRKQQ
jgi:hypothetical protein